MPATPTEMAGPARTASFVSALNPDAYRRYERQLFIDTLEELGLDRRRRAARVVPGHVPVGVSWPGSAERLSSVSLHLSRGLRTCLGFASALV
jgi:hypothetical protein